MPSNQEMFEDIKETTQRITDRLDDSDMSSDENNQDTIDNENQTTQTQTETESGIIDEQGNADAEALISNTASAEMQGTTEPDQETEDVRTESVMGRVNPEAELARLEQERQETMDTAAEDIEDAESRREDLISQREDAYSNIDSMESSMRQEQRRFEVDQTISEQRGIIEEMRGLRERSTDLMQQKQAALANLDQQAVSSTFITGQQNRISKAYNRRIKQNNALISERQAYLKSLQGQVEQARSLVSDVVNAKTYDTRMELKKTQDFLDLNKETLNRLDDEYKNAIEDTKKYWEDRLKEEEEEIDTVMNMMIKYPDAGVNSDDSLETALNKTQEQLQISIDDDIKDLMREYPGAGIDEDDTFKSAIKKVTEVEPESNYELRQLGSSLYRVNVNNPSDTQLIASGSTANPESYVEWQLAGEPGSYQDWVNQERQSDLLSRTELNELTSAGVPENFALDAASMIRQGETPAFKEGSEQAGWLNAVKGLMQGDDSMSAEELIQLLEEFKNR